MWGRSGAAHAVVPLQSTIDPSRILTSSTLTGWGRSIAAWLQVLSALLTLSVLLTLCSGHGPRADRSGYHMYESTSAFPLRYAHCTTKTGFVNEETGRWNQHNTIGWKVAKSVKDPAKGLLIVVSGDCGITEHALNNLKPTFHIAIHIVIIMIQLLLKV